MPSVLRGRSTHLCAAGLIVAAAGVGLVWASRGQAPSAVPVRIGVLLGVAAIVGLVRWRWVPALGLAVAAWAGAWFLGSGGPAALVGREGLGIAVGRWLQAAGLLIAAGAAVRALLEAPGAGVTTTTEHPPGDVAVPAAAARRQAEPGRWQRWAQVALLLVLAPVCAEYLAAYDESTGDPVALLGALLIFAPLYGAPALLIRELARRRGAGWPGMLLLAAAAGLLQAGVIDQSLFSVSYRGLDIWAARQNPTLIPGLGVSAHMALAFVGGHIAYSFAAPIALVEALAQGRRTEAWLGVGGLVVAGLAYVAAAALVLVDHLRTEASHASGAQVAGSLVVAAALIAWGMRRRASPPLDRRRRAPRPVTIGVVAFVAASVQTMAPETWLGTALSLAAIAAAGAWGARASRAAGWNVRHVTALATGMLLSRAGLAFTYFPLFGDVSPGRKYAHNVAMAALIVGMAALAARSARRHDATPAA